MPGWVSPWELLILVFIVLLVFGPKRLPEMGRSLGKGMREFKNSITGRYDRDDEAADGRRELPAASAERPARAPREHDAVG
jgi:sec-independent protein translocase protein TatA